MHSNYDILSDARRGLLTLRLAGTWDLAITAAFARDLTHGIHRLVAAGAHPDRLVALVDMRRKNLHTNHVAAGFGEVQRIAATLMRIALIASGAIHRLQVKRIMGAGTLAFFDDEETALAWLFTPVQAPPLAA